MSSSSSAQDKLCEFADDIVSLADDGKTPTMSMPSRSVFNSFFDQFEGTINLGSETVRRDLFNVSQAKPFMQTVLAASGCSELIKTGKTTSLRGLYYMLKHTIQGTKEETFDEQGECDSVIEDLELSLGMTREDLHLYAKSAGSLAGNLTVLDGEDTIDCSKMGAGGYTIPSIVEDNVLKIVSCTAKYILHVEKDTVWRRFNEDKFWKKHNCLITHGGGQPPRGVRRLLSRLNKELGLPVYCLLDNDPWGYYIYSVIKQGSMSLAFESKRMSVPECKYIGLRSIDATRCGLSKSVRIRLNDNDIKRTEQMMKYPWFSGKRDWLIEMGRMLDNGFKLEVESLISKDISYVTEVYVPERLSENDFLD